MRDAFRWSVPGRDRAILALLVGLAALAATFPLLQRPAEAQTTVWSATLTLDESVGFFGCDDSYPNQDNCDYCSE